MIAVAIYAFGGIRTVGVLLGSQHAAFEAEIVPASRALRVESRSGRRALVGLRQRQRILRGANGASVGR
ncbi:MAG: hypothetical protein DMG97_27910 [Acidobacteria bacterium]|nr:MAG: hypothetical protein DMG97_27910 [Acidobacteriota bacterium]